MSSFLMCSIIIDVGTQFDGKKNSETKLTMKYILNTSISLRQQFSTIAVYMYTGFRLRCTSHMRQTVIHMHSCSYIHMPLSLTLFLPVNGWISGLPMNGYLVRV